MKKLNTPIEIITRYISIKYNTTRVTTHANNSELETKGELSKHKNIQYHLYISHNNLTPDIYHVMIKDK